MKNDNVCIQDCLTFRPKCGLLQRLTNQKFSSIKFDISYKENVINVNWFQLEISLYFQSVNVLKNLSEKLKNSILQVAISSTFLIITLKIIIDSLKSNKKAVFVLSIVLLQTHWFDEGYLLYFRIRKQKHFIIIKNYFIVFQNIHKKVFVWTNCWSTFAMWSLKHVFSMQKPPLQMSKNVDLIVHFLHIGTKRSHSMPSQIYKADDSINRCLRYSKELALSWWRVTRLRQVVLLISG